MEQNKVNLGILSSIQVGDKLSIRDDNIISIDRPSIFQPFRRWMSSDSRDTTITKICDIVTNSIKITNVAMVKFKSKDNKNNQYVFETNLPNYHTKLKMAKHGLVNLCRSYEQDHTTYHLFQNHIQRLEDQVSRIVRFLEVRNQAGTEELELMSTTKRMEIPV